MFQPLAMPQVLQDCFRLLLQKADAVPDPFEQEFAQLLTDALRQLHEGSVVRWRLKRSEFLAWQVHRLVLPDS